MGAGNDHRAGTGGDLPAVVLVGAAVEAGAAGQIVEAGAGRPDADYAPGTGGADHRRRAARAVSSAVAQDHLGAGAARGLMNKTSRVLNQIRDYESRNVTFIEPDGSWP